MIPFNLLSNSPVFKSKTYSSRWHKATHLNLSIISNAIGSGTLINFRTNWQLKNQVRCEKLWIVVFLNKLIFLESLRDPHSEWMLLALKTLGILSCNYLVTFHTAISRICLETVTMKFGWNSIRLMTSKYECPLVGCFSFSSHCSPSARNSSKFKCA